MLARSLKNLELQRTLLSSLSASKTDRSRQPSSLLHVCRVQVPPGTKLNQVQAVEPSAGEDEAASFCFSVHVPMGAYRSSKCQHGDHSCAGSVGGRARDPKP